jgi:hypothetical protein
MITDRRIDHDRRRITLVIGPMLTIDDLISTIIEDAAACVWRCAVLCDQTATLTVLSADDVRTLAHHVQSLV